MYGIRYNRHEYSPGTLSGEWGEIPDGTTVVVPAEAFRRLLPEWKVDPLAGLPEDWQDWCGCAEGYVTTPCPSCHQSIALTMLGGNWSATEALVADNPVTHQLEEFSWSWSGEGVTEHWFDDTAVCLKKVSDYTSGTGLTADATRIVAFKRHVTVKSFRSGTKPDLELSRSESYWPIWAEFKNFPQEDYRANWTGRAYSDANGSGGVMVASDDLDALVESKLEREPLGYNEWPGEVIECRHLPSMKIALHGEKAVECKSFHLCFACRHIAGLRWDEFIQRNRDDVCPYFRRACAAVAEKSDTLPDWIRWNRDNLLAAHKRCEDGEFLAYEVVFVRKRDSFIRRLVISANSRTHEAWVHPYMGFIPKKAKEFAEKYPADRSHAIQGILGTEPLESGEYGQTGPVLSEKAVWADVAQTLTRRPAYEAGLLQIFDLRGESLPSWASRLSPLKALYPGGVQLDRGSGVEASSRSVIAEDKDAQYSVFYSYGQLAIEGEDAKISGYTWLIREARSSDKLLREFAEPVPKRTLRDVVDEADELVLALQEQSRW